MTDPILPAPVADMADNIVDAIIEHIDAETDPDLQHALYQRAYRHDWQIERHPGDPTDPLDGGHIVARFGDLREYVIPLVRVGSRRRTDA